VGKIKMQRSLGYLFLVAGTFSGREDRRDHLTGLDFMYPAILACLGNPDPVGMKSGVSSH
jgi:hypothetical protein